MFDARTYNAIQHILFEMIGLGLYSISVDRVNVIFNIAQCYPAKLKHVRGNLGV